MEFARTQIRSAMPYTPNIEIKGRAILLFEQSGTFKTAFKSCGIPAYDIDICNDFNQTDYIMDIFSEIDNYLSNRWGLFADITEDDFVMAFFPCTYFCDANALLFSTKHNSYHDMPMRDAIEKIVCRSSMRERYYRKFCQLISIAIERKFPLVIENPYSGSSFLKLFAPIPPAFVDTNRLVHGDYFRKPTGYWAVNCAISNGMKKLTLYESFAISNRYNIPGVKGKAASRSMISPMYARNFVKHCVLNRYEEPFFRLFSEPTKPEDLLSSSCS